MQKRVLLFLVTFAFWGASLLAQDVPEGVVAAFRKGSAQELKGCLSEQVDLLMDSRNVSTERETTLAKLSDFFTRNKVSSFSVNHQGKRNESSFVIGTLSTDKGDYRVNCFFKLVKNRYVVHQIRIDKINE
ncbi:MAG: DUF4783 domain-containing protein [Bacteroides sp.]